MHDCLEGFLSRVVLIPKHPMDDIQGEAFPDDQRRQRRGEQQDCDPACRSAGSVCQPAEDSGALNHARWGPSGEEEGRGSACREKSNDNVDHSNPSVSVLFSCEETKTSVKNECMYKSFGLFMQYIKNESIPKFREFLAKLTGYKNVIEMLNDGIFLEACDMFAENIINSAEKRNNASHGGTIINISQCNDDKRTVLNNLESARCNNIGLIQQLLYILNKRK